MSELKELLAKEIFEMVYQWGRVGVVVDHNAPAYKKVFDEFVTKTDLLKEIGFQNHADGDVCDIYNKIDNGSPNTFKPPTDCNCWKNAMIRNLDILAKPLAKQTKEG